MPEALGTADRRSRFLDSSVIPLLRRGIWFSASGEVSSVRVVKLASICAAMTSVDVENIN